MAGRNLLDPGLAPPAGRDLIALDQEISRPRWFNEAAAHASNLRGRATPDAYPGLFDHKGSLLTEDMVVKRLAQTEPRDGEDSRQLVQRVFGKAGLERESEARRIATGGRDLLDPKSAAHHSFSAGLVRDLDPMTRDQRTLDKAVAHAASDRETEATRAKARANADDWPTLGRKMLSRIVPLAKRTIGGLVEAMAENAPHMDDSAILTPDQIKLAQDWPRIVAEARARGEVPGQKIAAAAQEDLNANGYNFGGDKLKYYSTMLGENLIQMAPTIAATFATRSPGVGIAVAGAQAGGTQYADSRDTGRSPESAAIDAIWMGAAEAVGEKLPLGALMKPGGKFIPKALKVAGAEGAGEVITQILQTGYDKGVLNPDMTWGEAVGQVRDAGILGVLSGGIIGAATHGLAERGARSDAIREIGDSDIGAGAGAAVIDALSPDQNGVRPVIRLRQPQAPGLIEAANVESDPTPEDEASPLPTDIIGKGKALMAGATAKLGAAAILTRNNAPTAGSTVELLGQEWIVEDAFTDNGEDGLTLSREGQKQKVFFSDLADAGISMTPVLSDTEHVILEAATLVDQPDITSGVVDREAPIRDTQARKPASGSLPGDVVQFFKGRGYSDAQARGIAAGIAAESNGGDHAAINPDSGAVGLGQWLGSRKAELLRRYGPNPTRQQQLEFLDWELRGGDAGGKAVLAATDERSVLDAYIRKFMRPAAGAETSGDLQRGTAALGGPVDINVNNSDSVAQSATQPPDRSFLDDGPAADQPLHIDLPEADRLQLEAAIDESKGDGTPEAPRQVDSHEDIDKVVDRVVEPTDGQAEAGNYRKAHLKLHGLDITVENPKGSTRSGVSPEGLRWTAEIPATYGYVKRSTGADGDHSDVYIGPNPASPIAFVIDQYDPKTRKFDEQKTVLGVDSEEEARAIYDAGFSDGSGPSRRGGITTMPVEQFRQWVQTEQHEPAAPDVLPEVAAPTGRNLLASEAATNIPENIPTERLNASGSVEPESAVSFPAAGPPVSTGVETGGSGESPAPAFEGKASIAEPDAFSPRRRAGNLEEAKTAAMEFVGRKLVNERTGLEAVLSGRTLAKMTSASAVLKSTSPEDHALAVANADDLFQRAEISAVHPDDRGEPTIKAIHRLAIPMRTTDGRAVTVKMLVKETSGPNEPNPLYTIETVEVGPGLDAPQNGIESTPGQNRNMAQPGPESDIAAEPKKNNEAAVEPPAVDEPTPSDENDNAPEAEESPQATEPDAKERRTIAEEQAEVSDGDLAAVRSSLERRLDQLKLSDKVRLNLVDKIMGDRQIAGRYQNALITIALEANQDSAFTLNHEAVHALLDLGLIKPAEWTALTKAAGADKKLMARIRRLYADRELNEDQLLEEAVADMFAAWSAGDMAARGFIRDAFQRIMDFLRALGDALGGQFTTAESVMRAIKRGDVGARESGAPTSAEKQMVAWHGTPHDFDSFSTDKIGSGEGAQAYGWGLYFAGAREVAEHYRDKVKDMSRVREINTRMSDLARIMSRDEVPGRHRIYRTDEGREAAEEYDHLMAERSRVSDAKGRLYEADIPEDYEYLLWDQGLSEQPPQVKEALAKIPEAVMDNINGQLDDHGMNPVEFDDDSYTGMHLYRMLTRYSTEGALNDDYTGDDPKEDVSRYLHRLGIAGIKYLDGGSRRDGDGTHNYVVFDDSRVRVLGKFSLTEDPDGHLGAGAASPRMDDLIDAANDDRGTGRFAETFDRWRTALQDRMLPLLRTQQRIEAALGRPLEEDENAYLGEELLTGKVGAQLERLSEELVNPLFEAMKEEGVSLEELTSYAYARHAPERNARIAEINPEFASGGGSGMTDVEAAAIIARAKKDGRAEAIENVLPWLDKILAFAVDTRVEAGLLSQAEADAWRETYQHYVPLRGQAELDSDPNVDRPRRGSGINIKGKESKRAFGRRSKAEDIIAYSILQAEEAIIRAETNQVGQQFLMLARANPDPGFWQIDKIERRPVFNKASGQVQYQEQSRISAEDAPYTVSVKVDGGEHRITMNRNDPAAVRLADAMRNLTGHQFWPIVGFFGKFTRAFSALATRWNPPFVIVNAMRDIQTASVTLLQHDQKGMVRGVLKDWRKALVATKKGDGEWAKWRREFELAGGKVYFNDLGDISDIKKRIDRHINAKVSSPLGIKTALANFFHVVEIANDHVENAIRLAAYKNARQGGLSKAQAASIARNVTVNFTRRGKFGPVINAGYAFFNASTQGSATLIMAAVKSKKVRGAMLGFMVAGFALEMLNAMISDDDDDGESYWSKIPEHEKERNLILMIPGGKGQYVKIPIGLGLNALFNAGRALSEASRGARSPLSAAGEAVWGFADAFNPIGSGKSATTMILPTVLDPVAEIEENRDFADKPIQPDQSPYEPAATPSSNYFPSVSPIAKAITDAVNKATGGDEIRPGAVSVSPEVLEYLTTYFAAGTGRFISDVADLAMAPGDATVQDVPFANKVYGQKPRWVDKSAFYARVEDVERTVDYLKEYRKGRDREGFDALKEEKADVLQLVPLVKAARKEMREIRAARGALELAQDQGRIDDEAYATDKAVLDGAESVVITVFNKRYLETVAEPVGAE